MEQKELAFEAFLAADFKRAETLFKALLNEQRDDVELRFGYALSLFQQCNFKEAEAILESLALDNSALEIKSALWDCYIHLEKYRFAYYSILDVYKRNPDSIEVKTLYLRELRKLGYWRDAQAFISATLQDEHEHLPFLLECFLFHIECPVGDKDMAMSQLEGLYAISQNDFALNTTYAHALIRQNQGEKAREVLRGTDAIGVQKLELDAYLAWAEFACGDTNAANTLLYPLLSQIPSFPIVHIVYAYLQDHNHIYREAILHFSKVVNVYEGFLPEIRKSAEISVEKLYNPELALGCYEKLVLFDVMEFNDLLRVIWLAYSLHKREVVASYLSKAVSVYGKKPLFELIEILSNEEAENFLEEFVKQIPRLKLGEDIFSDYALAIYYAAHKDYERALKALKSGLSVYPNDALLNKALVEVYLAQGDWQKALDIGEAFLDHLPFEFELRSQIIIAALKMNDAKKAEYHERFMVQANFSQYAEWLEEKWAGFSYLSDEHSPRVDVATISNDERLSLFALWKSSVSVAALAYSYVHGAEPFIEKVQHYTDHYPIEACIEHLTLDESALPEYAKAWSEEEKLKEYLKGFYINYYDARLVLFKIQDKLEDILNFLKAHEHEQALLVNYDTYYVYALLYLERYDGIREFIKQFIDLEAFELLPSDDFMKQAIVMDGVLSSMTKLGFSGEVVRPLYERILKQAEEHCPQHLHSFKHNYSVYLQTIGSRVESERYAEDSLLLGTRSPSRKFGVPLWRGESLKGKRLLVWREQGVGDELAWIITLPEVLARAKAEGGSIIFECSPRLLSIFRRSFPEILVMSESMANDATRTDCDVHIPLGMLYLHTPPSFEAPPKPRAYLTVKPELNELWRERVAALGEGKKIGIAWRSGLLQAVRNLSYANLEDLAPLMALKGVHWVMLNYAHVEEGVRQVLERYGITLHTWDDLDLRDDFEGQAAMISQLDHVISATMTPGVLARVVGVETWTFWMEALTPNFEPHYVEAQYPALVWRRHHTETYGMVFERMAARLKEMWQLPE